MIKNSSPLSLALSLMSLTLLAFSSLEARASSTRVLVYPEDGLWKVRAFVVDGDGWTDTLEKHAYPTERMARSRASSLVQTLAADPIDSNALFAAEPREIRTPLLGEIWTAENEWSEEWEAKYADWVRTNFDADFYLRNNVKTDCADAAIALRWIYSREMHLPAGNRLAGSGALVTNRSVRAAWKNLPTAEHWQDDRRFRAALDYVLENTYTHSLHEDSYPLAIDPTYLREGDFHLEMRKEDGHTRVVSKIVRDGSGYPVQDLWSNSPRKVRELVDEPFTVGSQPPMNWGGFRGHRWVKLADSGAVLIRGEDMLGYSLEQYQKNFFHHGVKDFSAEVGARFQDSFNPMKALDALLSNIKAAIRERKSLVKDGYDVCSKQDCSPGSANYEAWSTPSRDARLKSTFNQVRAYLDTLQGDELQRFLAKLEKARKKKVVSLFWKPRSLAEIEEIFVGDKFTSDPRDPPKKRWGW